MQQVEHDKTQYPYSAIMIGVKWQTVDMRTLQNFGDPQDTAAQCREAAEKLNAEFWAQFKGEVL